MCSTKMSRLLAAIYAEDFPKLHSILATEGLPPSPWDYRLLEKAFFCNQPNMVELLIDYGCCVDFAKFHNNSTPLHLAIQKNSCSYELIESLLIRGAVVNRIDPRGETALHLAFHNSVDERIVNLLLCTHLKNSYRNEMNETGLSYLHIAATLPNVGYIERLVEQGKADINCRVHVDAESLYAGYTPLHMAVEFGRIDIAELLLKYGANLYIKDAHRSTPLHLALERRDEDFIDLLFDYDYEKVNHVNRYGLSHFMASCAYNNSNIVNDFLANLANGKSELDINESVSNSSNYSFKGYTPLLIAVEYGCIDTVRLLLANGARSQPTCQGLVLANVATKNEFYDIARLIKIHEQRYNIVDDDMCGFDNDNDCEMDWSFS